MFTMEALSLLHDSIEIETWKNAPIKNTSHLDAESNQLLNEAGEPAEIMVDINTPGLRFLMKEARKVLVKHGCDPYPRSLDKPPPMSGISQLIKE